MTQSTFVPRRHRIAWGAAAIVLIAISMVSVPVPRAFAQQNDQASADARKYLELLNNTFRFVLQSYVDQPDPKKLYEGAMKGIFESLGDPYSVFLDEQMMSDMTELTSGQFGGVGLYISKQLRDPKKPEDEPRYIEIVSPIEDTPGWKYGLKAGDLIIKIDGETTAPLSTDEAQKRIRGKPDSNVTLTIRRPGLEDFDATIGRARIEVPTVKHALIPTPKGNVGYLRIIEFTAQTKARVEDSIRDFEKTGYRALVIDVRNDPGGLLQSVIDVANYFIDSGVIVSTKSRNAYENSVARAKPGIAISGSKPIVILLNKGSASASEILAGALKDNKRAYLVGENSYGKGSVQQIYPIDGTGFKITIARYYTPSDENIDKTGIPPDLEAKEPDLSKAETDSLQKLFDSGRISEISSSWASKTAAEKTAVSKEFGLPENLLARLAKDEANRKSPKPPVYDLEYDVALKAALDVIDRPDYQQLLAATKTVKELVEAKKAAQALAAPAPAAKP
ncbi:MAG TPA: S41 family peptidase [Rectinemataceae bacterium]|nr:S41 family peptidase [Rectinemataceae bacterium]